MTYIDVENTTKECTVAARKIIFLGDKKLSRTLKTTGIIVRGINVELITSDTVSISTLNEIPNEGKSGWGIFNAEILRIVVYGEGILTWNKSKIF